VEQEREEPLEPAPVEDTNPEQDHGKPVHLTIFLELYFSFILLYDS
jgi:hypothetical protein